MILLTARNSEIDRVVGLEVGADDYVTKPFSPRELVARVRAILIKAIRAKLRKIDPDCDPIRTHRGLGYSVRVSEA